MIDIHTHILFGVDDGARDTKESLSLLLQGKMEGISTFFLTPHIYEFSEDTYYKINTNFQILNNLIKEDQRFQGVDLYLGSELHMTGDIFHHIDKGQCFLGKSKFLLLELPFDQVPFATLEIIKRLFSKGVKVIIAHPERNLRILRDMDICYKLKEAGAFLQFTAGSILGLFGKESKSFTKKALKKGLCDFVASDVHNLSWRKFNMQKAYLEMSKTLGNTELLDIYENNAYKYLIREY